MATVGRSECGAVGSGLAEDTSVLKAPDWWVFFREGRLIMVAGKEVVKVGDDLAGKDGDETGISVSSDGTGRGDSLDLVPDANDTAERGRETAECGRDNAECGRDRGAVGVPAAGSVVADVS